MSEEFPEKLSTTSNRHTGEKLPEEVKLKVLAYLKEGNGIASTAEEFGLSVNIVQALRKNAEDTDPAFNLAAWKKQTAATLSHFAAKGSKRLVEEVDKMPLASLPIAIAVAIDKIQALHDQPQTVVEHRLRVDHQSLNSMFQAEGIVLDGEFTEVNGNDTISIDQA
jgi:transposase-like protein